MSTYLIGTDGTSASEAICDYLAEFITEDDHLKVVVVAKVSDFLEANGERALELFEDRFGDTASVTTEQVFRGRSPGAELPLLADEIDADQIVVGLRRHSRTEQIIYGSVSQALVKNVTRPLILVPIPEYQTPASPSSS